MKNGAVCYAMVLNDKVFGLIEYSSVHCKRDCQVLMHGYEVFRGWMLVHTKLDVDNFTTIQSMASKCMLNLDAMIVFIKSLV